MNRRRLALYSTLAVCIAVTLVGVSANAGRHVGTAANAEDGAAIAAELAAHPAVFTLEATRTARGNVVLSGDHRVWSAVDHRYEPGSPQIAVDILDGTTWSTVGVFATDASGHYSGSERIGGAFEMRARATDASNRNLGLTSDTIMLTYDRPSKVVWTHPVATRRGHDGVTVSGYAFGAWARDTHSNNVDYLGRMSDVIVIDRRVDGEWVVADRVRTDEDGRFTATLQDDPGEVFRIRVKGSLENAKSSRVLKVGRYWG